MNVNILKDLGNDGNQKMSWPLFSILAESVRLWGEKKIGKLRAK